MFSRAAKSVVKNLGQRKCYVTDEKIKVRLIGAAEEIGQTFSQFAKTGPKLNGLSISNSRPKSHLMISAEKSQTLKSSQDQKIQDPRTESFPQNCRKKNNSVVSYFANRELDLEKTVTELRDKEIKLSIKNGLKKQAKTSEQQQITNFPLSDEKVAGQMWPLSRIAAVQSDSSAFQWRQLGQTRSEGLPFSPLTTQPRNAELTISRIPKVTNEAMTTEKLWLGDPDCGECPPDRPQKSPCHPPDGPCVPMKKPGYPARPKPAKKDFCFNCPPKRPCNLNKCPPNGCDGTSDKADFGQRNLLKLNSESQARNDMQSIVDNQAERLIDTSTGNDINDFQGVGQQFCLKPPDPSSRPGFPEVQTSQIVIQAKVLDQKYSTLLELAKPPECPNFPDAKVGGTYPIIISPQYSSLPKLQKCSECPKLVESEASKVPGTNFAPKLRFSSLNKVEKVLKKSASSLDCDAGKSCQPSVSKEFAIVKSHTIKFLATSTWNGNRRRHNQPNNFCRVQRHFCSSSDGSKSSKKTSTEDKNCSDKPKRPKPPSRPKPPKLETLETTKGPKVVYQKCPPLPKLPKLPECPKLPEVPPKCPPLPKLPKLPKCPECPKSAEPKSKPEKASKNPASIPKCHATKSTTFSKVSSTVKDTNQHLDHPKDSFCCSTVSEIADDKITKKKGLWDKIRDATKREMSTYTLINLNPFKPSDTKNQKRHLWTCSISCSSFSSKTDPPSFDSHPPWKSRKCKTVEEVCGEVVDPKLKALECKPMNCPKNHNTPCYPDKPRCAEVKKPPEKISEKDKNVSVKSSDCLGQNKDIQRTSVVDKPVEKIEYKMTQCVKIGLLKAGPCPAPQINLKDCKDGKSDKASSHPLPKPPAPPVHLCRCTPPPKLHPGSCPCREEAESSTRTLTEPCTGKSKYSCPESPVYYCPPIKQCDKKDKVCQGNKKTK